MWYTYITGNNTSTKHEVYIMTLHEEIRMAMTEQKKYTEWMLSKTGNRTKAERKLVRLLKKHRETCLEIRYHIDRPLDWTA